MFRLTIATDACWLDLPHGVRVLVKPLSGLVMQAARTHAVHALSQMRQQFEERQEAGAPTDGLPDLSDPVIYDVMLKWELARGMGKYGIIDFQGVADDTGQALPFTPARAEALSVHPEMMEAFVNAYTAQLDQVTAEGNASSPAPSGSTDVGVATAPAVPPPAETARPN